MHIGCHSLFNYDVLKYFSHNCVPEKEKSHRLSSLDCKVILLCGVLFVYFM